MSERMTYQDYPLQLLCEVCGMPRYGFLEAARPIPNWQGPGRIEDYVVKRAVPFDGQQVVRVIVLCEDHYDRALDGICYYEGGSGGVSAWAPEVECDDPFHDGEDDGEEYTIDMSTIIATGWRCRTCGFQTISAH